MSVSFHRSAPSVDLNIVNPPLVRAARWLSSTWYMQVPPKAAVKLHVKLVDERVGVASLSCGKEVFHKVAPAEGFKAAINGRLEPLPSCLVTVMNILPSKTKCPALRGVPKLEIWSDAHNMSNLLGAGPPANPVRPPSLPSYGAH